MAGMAANVGSERIHCWVDMRGRPRAALAHSPWQPTGAAGKVPEASPLALTHAPLEHFVEVVEHQPSATDCQRSQRR